MTTKKLIINVETGEQYERDLTESEIKKEEEQAIKAEADKEAQALKATAKAALLDKLGITEEEAKLLLS